MNLFKPRLPISDAQRIWIDDSLSFYIDLFSRDVIERPVVEPTPEFFPTAYAPTEEWAETTICKVCELMSVDRSRLDVVFVESDDIDPELRQSIPSLKHQYHGAAGTYHEITETEKSLDGTDSRITLTLTLLDDPIAFVGTVAHEIAHVILLGDRRIPRDIKNMEPLTDLYTVFCGMGIFTANSAFSFRQWSENGRHGWSTQRHGYLSEQMFSYALAAYAVMRHETSPKWIKYLNYNVKSFMKQSTNVLRYESSRA